MAKQFLHITLRFADGGAHINELKPVFNKAITWFRYAPTNWIVWTSSSAEKWYERLRPHISDDDTVFIGRLDVSETQGWVSRSFWDWLQQERKTD
ncbi:MAG: hypothetical protein WBD53_07720 [Xanthobacteraceae bacterium]